jgi:putative sterol carrier protein
MVSGPGGDSFHGEWLVVALDALMEGRSANEPTTIGLEVDDTVVAVHVDETGAQVDFDGRERPDTVLRGAPEVVLGLASGVLTVDQAVGVGELRGQKADLVAVFGSR